MPSSQKGLSKRCPRNLPRRLPGSRSACRSPFSPCLPAPVVSNLSASIHREPGPWKSLRALRFGFRAALSTSPVRLGHFLLKNPAVVCRGVSRTSGIPRTVSPRFACVTVYNFRRRRREQPASVHQSPVETGTSEGAREGRIPYSIIRSRLFDAAHVGPRAGWVSCCVCSRSSHRAWLTAGDSSVFDD